MTALLKRGVNVNVLNKVLIHSLTLRTKKIIPYFLFSVDKGGSTCLMEAIMSAHYDMAEFLLLNGVDASLIDKVRVRVEIEIC